MRYAILLLLLCFLLTGAAGCGRTPSFSTAEDAVDVLENMDTVLSVIYVDVCGEVEKPAVYCLEENARVCDAVAAAGGFTDAAAKEDVNQARTLCDGEQLRIPSLEDMRQSVPDGLVNINTADINELMTLPGIGQSKAADIISYRMEHGAFQKTEDLMQIPGIKEGLYQKLKDKIKI